VGPLSWWGRVGRALQRCVEGGIELEQGFLVEDGPGHLGCLGVTDDAKVDIRTTPDPRPRTQALNDRLRQEDPQGNDLTHPDTRLNLHVAVRAAVVAEPPVLHATDDPTSP
jgi:hypothetical protein